MDLWHYYIRLSHALQRLFCARSLLRTPKNAPFTGAFLVYQGTYFFANGLDREMKAYRILCEVDGCRKCHVFAVFVDGLALRRNCAMILNLKMLSMR